MDETSPSLPPEDYEGRTTRPAFVRLVRALAFAGLVGFVVGHFVGAQLGTIAGWDAGGAYLLGSGWWIIARASPEETRRRAAAEDPGRRFLFVLVLLASSISIFANAVVLKHASTLSGPLATAMISLCVAAAVIAWLLTHTTYSLRYAHLFYREDDCAGSGLEFPGGRQPCDIDFAYFAFTIGMCFQVSDVVITSRQIRRATLGHALLSFAFNTFVLALALNLVFGLVQ